MTTSHSALHGLRRPYPDEQTTLDLIDQQVRLAPDAPAVIFGEQRLSYRRFDRLANELACLLLEQGAQPGRLLPLLVSDGLELPLAIVATMKAGIPFVPMDPRWPTERTAALLTTLETDLLVAGPRTPDSATVAGRRIAFDAGLLTGSEKRPDAPRPERADIFYGFFTSGTTGLPKCTLNHHRGLLNRFTTMTRMFGGGHVALQNSRSVFDSSLWQMLWPLSSGGTVVMPVREGLLDLEQTVCQIGRYGVTITDFVPSIFAVLADLLHADAELARQASSLRRVLLGGEAINVAAVRRFHQVLPHVEFTNTYGPTEASIGSVFHSFQEPPADGLEIPIGSPIDNTSVVIVDADLAPLGPDQTGELLIGGDCVGYGYLADPERTARSFIRNPFPDIAGERLYRTGDLAQYRQDGLLYFVGRADDQIKLRGVRIEPTEVENALIELPGIREAKVFVDGELDRAQLVAAVVSDRPVTAELLEAARAALPPEFVPDRFVRLERLPLSPNGKADRRALAAHVRDAEAGPAGQASGAGVQARIEQLWAEVLPHTGHGPNTSFFDLGGTSLSAQRLVLALRAAFGRPITVHDIANNPTVAAQTALLESEGGEQAASQVEQILADQHLDAWSERRTPPNGHPRSILLTGASGFIGSYLLESLLRETTATVTCLIRAEDPQSARQLLNSRLDYYQLGDVLDDPRIRIEVGDLAQPRWGLTEERFAALADSVDAIVHSGAQVNLVTPYSGLRATNVTSVRTLIELARRGRAKTIHHLSTFTVLPRATAVDEDTCLVEENLPADGYSQSKWCAERLLAAAREQGLVVNVYRLGEVMPHSATGIVSHTGSLTEMLLEGCRRLGTVTRTGAASDFSPVDAVASFIGRAVAAPSPSHPSGACYHVAGRDLRLDDVLDQLSATAELDQVGYGEFWRRLQEASIDEDAPQALRKLGLVLPERPGDELAPLADQFFTSTSAAFRRNFLLRCEELGLRWPEVGTAVLETWCRGTAAVAG